MVQDSFVDSLHPCPQSMGIFRSGVIIENMLQVGQDSVNIGVVTIFRLAKTSLLQVY